MIEDGWSERFTISVSYYMPVPHQYDRWRVPLKWPTSLEGRVLKFGTFEEATSERRWRLNHPEKWLPPDATYPEVSEVLRTVYTRTAGAVEAPRFNPQLNRGGS